MEKKRPAPLCRQPIGLVRSRLQLQQRQIEPRRFPARWLRLWRETIGAWILPAGLAEKRTGHLQKQPLQRTDRKPSAPGPDVECR
jgi:hypothetical protein